MTTSMHFTSVFRRKWQTSLFCHRQCIHVGTKGGRPRWVPILSERQEDLLAHLREEGFDVTQATVSRDIRELQLVKTATADGRYRYVPASASGKVTHSPSRFEMIFRESVLKVDYAGHMVLVKCFSGMANAACEVFDAKQWDNVVGTLSGDDTFFILMRSEDDAAAICKQLQQYTRRG